jgi:hypothetical protein
MMEMERRKLVLESAALTVYLTYSALRYLEFVVPVYISWYNHFTNTPNKEGN